MTDEPAGGAALALLGVSKRFGGVLALDGVSLDIRPGEVHAVMGENGAGKSTLMKVASGVHRPDRGRLALAGRDVSFRSPAEAAAAGVQVVFQELTVLPNRSVAENLLLGREPMRAGGLWLDRGAMREEAQRALDALGVPLEAGAEAGRLSAGQRQMLEIARAVSRSPRVLILDEPTSSLGRAEEEALFALVARLKAAGVGLAYITHRMAEVFALADRVSVLRDGRHVATAPAADWTRGSLIRAMVGRGVEERRAGAGAAAAPERPVALAARGIARGAALRGADLELRGGEVLGVAGLMGAGRTELARVLAGADRPEAGTMTLFGKPYAPRGVAEAVLAGVAYVSEDRKALGLVLAHSVESNMALPSLRRLARRGFVRRGAVAALAREWMGRLGVKAASPGVAVETLSGGNQQKVALARWLALRPRVILLDEPTRGVDVGAKAEIHALVRRLASEGAAVLVVSSELPEVLQVSDRIAVMARGRVAGVVGAEGATEESLLALAFAEAA